ncbi:MAG: HAD family hydrolase [Limisphaerales bacterium]|jgi:HAD superfamily hydrolase (TIGR01509 family)
MKSPKAVIFDMDGVVVDSEPLHEQAFLDVFAELGLRDSHGLHFPSYYGRSDEAVWRDFMTLHRPSVGKDDLVARKRDRFLALLEKEEPIFHGLPELLEQLHAHYPLALASGSAHPIINGVLALRGLRRYFQAVVSAQDVGAEKPRPDIFLHTSKLIETPPKHCWVIEDSVAGVQGARAAGMTVIAITNSLPASDLSEAHHIVSSYEEIARLLLPQS